ncbi:hypothetical protein H2248_003617 [Termitomyces sp. 'cryptogamus']|nr:hypothetical protein H2248_003617 [Termitomyces sp. 'cryptogamus']
MYESDKDGPGRLFACDGFDVCFMRRLEAQNVERGLSYDLADWKFEDKQDYGQ